MPFPLKIARDSVWTRIFRVVGRPSGQQTFEARAYVGSVDIDDTARLGRQHNDANVVSVGARMHDEATAVRLVEAFLATPYSGEERHSRRIAMLTEYESTGQLPDLP